MNNASIQQQSIDTPHKKVKGAPDYDDALYWDTKFMTGQDVGEWLNKGDMLLDVAINESERRYPSSCTTRHEVSGPEENVSRPRVLHLGPGISALGSKLCEAFIQRGWKGSDIVNVDFSSEAVRLGRESEHGKRNPDHMMHWIQADLCSWTEVSISILPLGPFDVIIDKSTSDAIATAVPRTFYRSAKLVDDDGNDDNHNEEGVSSGTSNSTICPSLQDILLHAENFKDSSNGILTLSPVELLSMHVASLARKDAVWAVLSYSSVRFDDLPYLSRYWTLASRTPLKAPAGQASSGTTMVPDVFHWVYVLRRK